MGDLSEIKVPSKYAARMGQCFSSTVSTVRGVTGWRGRFERGCAAESSACCVWRGQQHLITARSLVFGEVERVPSTI